MGVSHEEAFLDDWSALSAFGAVAGTTGVDRQAATEPDGEQRRWLDALLTSEGFTVHRDAIGNQFALCELVPGAPYVLTGSHLDSQPTAGRFDGAYGVLASAHAAIRTACSLRETGEATRNIAVVNWFNEEGSRFKPSMMGSSVFTGKLSLEDALATVDRHGVTVREALEGIGERGDAVAPEVASYLEIHVEQGRAMAENGITIGLVEATWGAHKFEIRVTGEQAHSGSALMRDRRDALLAASRLVVAARDLVERFPEGMLHTAVGELHVYPNSPVVVASEARLLLDLRSESAEVLAAATAALMAEMERIAAKDRVGIEIVAEHAWDRNPYGEAGLALARSVASEMGLPHARVLTIAGHDSTNMKDIAPTVMLFVPSVDGVSHNVNEYTTDADLLAGVEATTEVLRRLVCGALS
ncbi:MULTISPECIES: M20 family metallo-hydrolase [Microbacterium]|uniref:Zn-dependent hydrolase n=1 Tax=Microbacterium wangchenii TaxID=2541726 RepID=A0ABX5SXC4_9MICO|nr:MULTISPECIES: M20 family metallo-hydrolase [Microbacterium]MCK6067137.1 M20 family metallo-hydrolase [Microbacterium sp. EYE_512]QBR89905.1 Zn-dependent hydrolase [Microbacterium wangchenii]TXK16498.1 M20 family metallo-hydrolase [Microbacterium wangchenii]